MLLSLILTAHSFDSVTSFYLLLFLCAVKLFKMEQIKKKMVKKDEKKNYY